jgi:hypothetical protein
MDAEHTQGLPDLAVLFLGHLPGPLLLAEMAGAVGIELTEPAVLADNGPGAAKVEAVPSRASRHTCRSILCIERLFLTQRTSLNVYAPDISNVYDTEAARRWHILRMPLELRCSSD